MIGLAQAAPIAAALLLVGLVSVTGYSVGQAKTIGRLEAEHERALAVAAQAQVDLSSKTAEASRLREAYGLALREIQLGKEEAVSTRARIEELEQQVTRSRAHVRVERETIYRLPGCQELAALDIGAVCPSLAGSLRRRAAEVSSPR